MFSLKNVVCRTASGVSASLNAQARSSIFRVNQTAAKAAFQYRFYQDDAGRYRDDSRMAGPVGGANEFSQPPRGQPNFQMPQRRPTPTPKETVYVGNVTFETKPEDLEREFSKYGNVVETRLIYDRRGVSRGFGYITFETTEQARAAIGAMHMQVLDGRRLALNFAQKSGVPAPSRESVGGDSDPTRTLYIGNLAFEMTDREMNDLFKNMYNLVDVRVAVDRKTGHPRGFCHAEFVDVESALAAREMLEDMAPHGRRLKLDYSNSSPGRLDRYLAERGMVRSPTGEITIAATGEPANLHAGRSSGESTPADGAPSSETPQ